MGNQTSIEVTRRLMIPVRIPARRTRSSGSESHSSHVVHGPPREGVAISHWFPGARDRITGSRKNSKHGDRRFGTGRSCAGKPYECPETVVRSRHRGSSACAGQRAGPSRLRARPGPAMPCPKKSTTPVAVRLASPSRGSHQDGDDRAAKTPSQSPPPTPPRIASAHAVMGSTWRPSWAGC